MPTNLPPEAQKAEIRYREAEQPADKLRYLEEFLSLIPKHKGTDHLRADVKQRISKLRASLQSVKKNTPRIESPFHIKKEGGGQVILIGPTGVGKSALVRSLTNASPESSPTPFTTWIPLPGMMPYQNIQIQLVDTPSLDRGYMEPEFIDLLRKANLVCLVIDLLSDPVEAFDKSLQTLNSAGFSFFDIEKNHPKYPPVLLVLNKHDDQAFDENYEICRELIQPDSLLVTSISAHTHYRLSSFQQMIYSNLGVIRVYAKPPNKEADLNAPFVLHASATIEEFAGRVHKDFITNLRYARVWGSGDFDGQMVSKDFSLSEGDIVELHI